MTKQPEDWLDDVPGDDIEDEDDEIKTLKFGTS